MTGWIHLLRRPEGWTVEIYRAAVDGHLLYGCLLATLGPYKKKPNRSRLREWQFRLELRKVEVYEEYG